MPFFLKLPLSMTSICVGPPLRLLIASGVICTPYAWLNKFYSFYMAAIVSMISRYSLTVEEHHRNQPNKSKLGH